MSVTETGDTVLAAHAAEVSCAGRRAAQPHARSSYLLAAGPLTDMIGEGMTILRLPGANQIQQATRLATEDDTSVVSGFFTVTVRPWQVMMQAQAISR